MREENSVRSIRIYVNGADAACPRAAEPPAWATLQEVECEHIRRTLAYTNGNEEEAARLLDMDGRKFRRRLRQYDLETVCLPLRRAPQFERPVARKAA